MMRGGRRSTQQCHRCWQTKYVSVKSVRATQGEKGFATQGEKGFAREGHIYPQAKLPIMRERDRRRRATSHQRSRRPHEEESV